MDVNQVRFGNYSIGNPNGGAKKSEEQEAKNLAKGAENQEVKNNFDIDAMFKAMNIAGMQNLAYVSKAEAKEVNPSDYLSEERISDIEAMMAEFDSGVETIANSIEEEFPGVFAEDKRNALAAQIFAAE